MEKARISWTDIDTKRKKQYTNVLLQWFAATDTKHSFQFLPGRLGFLFSLNRKISRGESTKNKAARHTRKKRQQWKFIAYFISFHEGKMRMKNLENGCLLLRERERDREKQEKGHKKGLCIFSLHFTFPSIENNRFTRFPGLFRQHPNIIRFPQHLFTFLIPFDFPFQNTRYTHKKKHQLSCNPISKAIYFFQSHPKKSIL